MTIVGSTDGQDEPFDKGKIMRLMTLGAAALVAMTATPADAVTTVLTFTGNICSGGTACGNGSAIDQGYGDSEIQNVTYRSFVTATGTTFESFLKYWSTGYGDLQGSVWGGVDPINYTSEIVLTPAAGYEISLVSFQGACYLNRATCQTFPYAIASLGGDLIGGTSISPPAGGHSTVAVNSGYFSNGIVLHWGPDSYDGGLDDITFDVRALVMPGAVPEPASWAMMIMGFGAIGGALRRRGLTRRSEPALA